MKDAKSKKQQFVKPIFSWSHIKRVGIRNVIPMTDDEYVDYKVELRNRRILAPFWYFLGLPMAFFAAMVVAWVVDWAVVTGGVEGVVKQVADFGGLLCILGVAGGVALGADQLFRDQMSGKTLAKEHFDRYWAQQEAAYQVEHLEVEEIRAVAAPGKKKGLLMQAADLYARADTLYEKRDFSGYAKLRDAGDELSKESKKRDAEEMRARKAKQGDLL